MYKKILTLCSILIGLIVFSSCSEDLRITKNLYDDWWPVHASGSFDSDYFTASWDGDLDKHGLIEVTYVSKTNPSLNYKEFKSYPALSFNKKKETFCYYYIQNLSNITSSKDLKFYVKDKMIYLEKMTDTGRGSGSYLEGRSISFQGDDILKIILIGLGIFFGILVLIAVILAIYFVLRKKRK